MKPDRLLGGDVGGVDVAGMPLLSSVLERGPESLLSTSKLRPVSEISEFPMERLAGSSCDRLIESRLISSGHETSFIWG